MCCFYHPASIQLIFCNPPPLALPLSKVNICDTKNLNNSLYWGGDNADDDDDEVVAGK